jgi:hypothetical protein
MGDRPEWFQPTSGRFVGTTGVVVAAAVLVLIALDNHDEDTISYAAGVALAAIGCWVLLLRPRVGLTADTLVIRQALRTVHLPLAAIEKLAVSQVLAVWVEGRRFVSPAIGKPLRRVVREARPGGTPGRLQAELEAGRSMPYVDFVEERIRQQRVDAIRTRDAAARRAGAEAAGETPATVRVDPAWAEIVGLGVACVVLLVSLLV